MTIPTHPRWHRTLFGVAAIMTWILVTSGGVVCITDSSHGCPDWPVCHGRLIPPAQMNSIIEWLHRVASPVTLPFIIAAAVVGWRRHRCTPWIVRSALGSIACILVVVVFGAIAILAGLPRGWAAADLGTALLALALMVTAATVMSTRFDPTPGAGTLTWRAPFTRLALASSATVWAVIVSGVLVARPGSVVRCLGWPSWSAVSAPTDVFGWLTLVRLGLAALATVLVIATALHAWRMGAAQPQLRLHAVVNVALLFAATLVAALVPAPDEGVFVPMANMVLTSVLWSLAVAVAVRAAATPWARQ